LEVTAQTGQRGWLVVSSWFVKRVDLTGKTAMIRSALLAFFQQLCHLRGHWKFGQEISDERCVDERLTKGHVAQGLTASRNEDELPVLDALLSTIDDPRVLEGLIRRPQS
jgi:hypothetical protein